MAAFEYRQAGEIRDAFKRRGVRYLFIGKSGAILLGFPDTTQDADVFVDRSPENGRAIAAGLRDLGFNLSEDQASEIEPGKVFVQLKSGPFDLDLVFAPNGIERFDDAWKRHVDVEGFPVCHPRRHHRKQSRREPRTRPRIAASTESLSRLLDQTENEEMTDNEKHRCRPTLTSSRSLL
jgi:hypothetical protein